MVAAPGVDEDEVVGRGGRGGGDGLEVNGGLGRGVGQAEFIKETELLAEEKVSVVGSRFAKFSAGARNSVLKSLGVSIESVSRCARMARVRTRSSKWGCMLTSSSPSRSNSIGAICW